MADKEKGSKKKKKQQQQPSQCASGCCGGGSNAENGAVGLTQLLAGGAGQDGANNALPQLDGEQLVKIRKAMDMLQLQKAASEAAAAIPAKTSEDAAKKTYEFWSKQPVPKLDEEVTTNEAIEPDVPLDKLKQEPYSLPNGFTWDTLNIDDPLVLKELYVLLNENYVEDDDNMFRFDYSPEFLRWALQPPGSRREWHCGVRAAGGKSNKLVGFISAVPAHIKVYDKKMRMVEINFLCVHKKLRSKRMAPVLIREITRRVNCTGIFQAVYTAGVVLPKPVATCRYWHRSLNPKKLIEVKFSHLSRNMTMQRHLKLYRLPDETKTKGLRRLRAEDVPDACKLMNDFLSRYKLGPVFSEEDFSHWFLPRENIIDTYVVESTEESAGAASTGASSGAAAAAGPRGRLTDIVSFYSLPSTVMNHASHKTLRAAYSFYNVSTATPWVDLIGDALVLAKKANYDVFNALDLMENESFLEKLKFGIGDGNLQYYVYNWRCPHMKPSEVGLVLQ